MASANTDYIFAKRRPRPSQRYAARPRSLFSRRQASFSKKALKLYRDMADKNWSLTDCASFLIMEEEGLTAALTHDRHFAQAGFHTLLR